KTTHARSTAGVPTSSSSSPSPFRSPTPVTGEPAEKSLPVMWNPPNAGSDTFTFAARPNTTHGPLPVVATITSPPPSPSTPPAGREARCVLVGGELLEQLP